MSTGKSPFEILVEIELIPGELQMIQLTKQVWCKQLLTGVNPLVDTFLTFFTSILDMKFTVDKKLNELHHSSEYLDLFQRIKIFHYDLKTFNELRLFYHPTPMTTTTPLPFYLNTLYFTMAEIEYLLTFPTAQGLTVAEHYSALLEGKQKAYREQGTAVRLCASHDLAPLLERLFGLRKGYDAEKGFVKYKKAFDGHISKKIINSHNNNNNNNNNSE